MPITETAEVRDHAEAAEPERAEWERPDFAEFATPPEVTAYAGQR